MAEVTPTPCPGEDNRFVGTDIYGFVECRTWGSGPEIGATAWYSAVDLSLLGVDRDYAAFGCLFGVRGPEGHWRPAAGCRRTSRR